MCKKDIRFTSGDDRKSPIKHTKVPVPTYFNKSLPENTLSEGSHEILYENEEWIVYWFPELKRYEIFDKAWGEVNVRYYNYNWLFTHAGAREAPLPIQLVILTHEKEGK